MPRSQIAGLLLACLATAVGAVPIDPQSDDEVIEVLPAVSGNRREERRERQRLAERPQDASLAVDLARRYLDKARASGDPRFAGLAMAALAAWTDEAAMPDDVLLLRATLQQYLHDFDAAAAGLQRLLARPSARSQPQAWLTLATVRRVQGRYADSDAACREVGRARASLHASACLAENAALRGHVDSARTTLAGLLTQATLPAATRSWLLTTLAELEQRDGRVAAAESAFQASLKLEADDYTRVAYADLLIEQQRPLEALRLLADQTRTDAVVLRLAIAGAQAKAPTAAGDIAEMRDRIALANERPEARLFHGREQAMFALAVEHAPAFALAVARGNVERQREPIDLLVLARAARASGQPESLEEVRRLCNTIGLHDRRIQALL